MKEQIPQALWAGVKWGAWLYVVTVAIHGFTKESLTSVDSLVIFGAAFAGGAMGALKKAPRNDEEGDDSTRE